MGSRLRDTTFVGGADNELITVDAYNKEDSISVNKDPGSSDTAKPDAMEAVKGGNNLPENAAEDMAKEMNKDSAGSIMSPEGLMDGVVSNNPDLLSSFKSLSSDVQNKLLEVKDVLKPIQGLASNISNGVNTIKNIKATVDGITKNIKNANLDTLENLSGLINSLSNNTASLVKFTDISGLSTLSSNVIKVANASGIPDAFNNVCKGIDDLDVINNITKNLIPDIINNSSTSLLLQVANGTAGKNITNYLPNFINDFTTNYTKPIFNVTKDIVNEFNNLKTSFTAINPKWNIGRIVNDDASIDASSWSNASNDFIYVVQSATKLNADDITTYNPATIDTSMCIKDEVFMLLTYDIKTPDILQELNMKFPTVIHSSDSNIYNLTSKKTIVEKEQEISEPIYNQSIIDYKECLERINKGSKEVWLGDVPEW